MSETVAKESILTRAMKAAEAKKLTLSTDTETNETEPTTSRKKLIAKALLATVAAGAVTYLVVKLTGNDTDEETDSETNPED